MSGFFIAWVVGDVVQPQRDGSRVFQDGEIADGSRAIGESWDVVNGINDKGSGSGNGCAITVVDGIGDGDGAVEVGFRDPSPGSTPSVG